MTDGFERMSSGRRAVGRHRKGRDLVDLLGVKTERDLAGDEEPQPGRGSEEIRKVRGGACQLLEVIEDEQDLALAEVFRQQLGGRPPTGFLDTEGSSDRRGQEFGIPDRGQPADEDAVRELAPEALGDRQREG